MGLVTALKAFTAALFDRQAAADIDALLAARAAGEPGVRAIELAAADEPATTPPRSDSAAGQQRTPNQPARSEAVTLLATLQRESRLVDLIFEDLAQYGDAQVGAAARPCLQQCKESVQRMLNIQPLLTGDEGQLVKVDATASANRIRRVSEAGGEQAKLVHHGWQATAVNLPQWTGDPSDADVIAPAQVQ